MEESKKTIVHCYQCGAEMDSEKSQYYIETLEVHWVDERKVVKPVLVRTAYCPRCHEVIEEKKARMRGIK
jgi:ssDNA-binding Zn-finger/Zn-ribbon topoisomerase 1